MKKNITPNQYNSCNDREKKVVVPSPSVERLNYLKQFARSYYVEQELPVSLSGIYVN